MALIWVQSAYFQPESVPDLPWFTLISLGIMLELAHFVQFGILYVFLIIASFTFGPLRRKEAFAAAMSAGFALVDELHQHFVPFRSASVDDLVKDGIGIAVAWWWIRRSYASSNSRFGRWLRRCAAIFPK